MKLEIPAGSFVIFVLVAVLAAGLISAERVAVAQTGDSGGSAGSDLEQMLIPPTTVPPIDVSGGSAGPVGAEAVATLSGSGVAAEPSKLPLTESDVVGSVMYRRSDESERFDTDRDIDPPSSPSGASGAEDSTSDREVIGSHYLLGDTFNVRVPASYVGKPSKVFAFSFNHIVLQAGSGRVTAGCDNQRVFAYRDSGAARWRCDLDFGNSVSVWGQAVASAAQVSIGAAWSDAGCEALGEYGVKQGEDFLTADCKALLAIKYHWLDEYPRNRNVLNEKHALWSWGSGDIKSWDGIRVGGFYEAKTQFEEDCARMISVCPNRVLNVDLSSDGRGRISGVVPWEFGGFENANSNCAKVTGSGFGFGFKGAGCGLGALQLLDLRDNSLSGSIPWQLGNVSVAPCNPSVKISKLDVDAAIALGLFLIGLLATPFTGGASLSLNALGIGVGIGSAFVDVDVKLDEHLFGCSEASQALSRRIGSDVGDDSAVSFEREKVKHKFSGVAAVSNNQYDASGRSLFPSMLFGFEAAGHLTAGIPDDELLKVRVGNIVREVKASSIRAAGRLSGYFGALLDVKDIVSDLYQTEERDYLHLDRSQLQFLILSDNHLTGSVPVEISDLDSLEILYLDNNNLSGSAPGDAGRGGRPAHDKLVHLNLSNNNFSGVIPSVLSTRLHAADFSSNEFQGSVPSSLSLLFGLRYLDLSRNGLSGQLPSSIANLDHLEVLHLNNNNLTGMLPLSIGELNVSWCWYSIYNIYNCLNSGNVSTARLQVIDISHNLFHRNIPQNLGNLTNLSLLHLQYNCFNGDVPKSLIEKSAAGTLSLKYEYNLLNSNLNMNSAACGPCFDGTYLPVSADDDLKSDCVTLVSLKNHWGPVSNLQWGDPRQQRLSSWEGVELKSHGNLSQSGNRVVGLRLSNRNLAGTVPGSLANLDDLTTLHLDRNQLTGEIPTVLNELPNLETLNLSHNELSGEIPSGLWKSEYSRNLFTLESLDLSHNELSGEIPFGFLESLGGLQDLDLSHNSFTGPIPLKNFDPVDIIFSPGGGPNGRGLGNLVNLEKLNLSHNLLTGEIPSDISKVGYLSIQLYNDETELRLNSNCLTGTIPEDLTKIGLVDISNNNLDYSDWKGTKGTAGEECVSGGCSGGVLVANPGSNAGLVDDCETLLALRVYWHNSAVAGSWATGNTRNINSWRGVTVTGGRVTGLELTGEGLSGEIPERIGRLLFLRNLKLSGNSLTGVIPATLRHLTSLQVLELSDNMLSGKIPTGMGEMVSLQTLSLHNNQLTGSIPAELGRLSGLRSLKLQNNELTGGIPSELAGLSSLTGVGVVNLSMNCLLGPVPARIARVTIARGNLFGTSGDNPDCGDPCSDGTFMPSVLRVAGVVVSLLVDDCRALWAARKHWDTAGTAIRAEYQLWGTAANQDITTWPGVTVIGGRVREVDLSVAVGVTWTRQIRGTLPAELAELEALEILNLSGNRLSGAIPPEFDQLANLVTLNLSRNLLSGSVHISLGRLTSLLTLDLSHNRLTGQPPSITTRTYKSRTSHVRPHSLEYLYLNDNQFTGIIPSQIAYHANLRGLRLSNNSLSGPIPAAISSLRMLSDLRLDNNELTGTVPTGLGRVTNLRYLHLQNNCLTGRDPGPTLRITFAYYISLLANAISFPDINTRNNLFNHTATQNKSCYKICQNSVPNPTINTELVKDCEALLAIRDKWAAQTTLPERAAMTTWGSRDNTGNSLPIDQWHGVTLRNNRVIWLDINSHNLTSPAPAELANLTELTSLNLSHNQLSNFPASTLELNKLEYLNLSPNNIETIPSGIAGLNRLITLDLSFNELSGDIPTYITELPWLINLDLSSNNLSGFIPKEIGDLRYLLYLDLSGNNLSGSIPPEMSKLDFLEYLDLGFNDLSGSIPSGIGDLMYLRTLRLSFNDLSGTIPAEIGNLLNLEHLEISFNVYLSGSIPPGIWTLQYLRHLDLSYALDLSEAIPSEIGNLRNLEHLNLSGNNISGSIPPEIGNLRNLHHLDLSFNNLLGPIPSEIGNLTRLWHLDLSENFRLCGPIPAKLRRFVPYRPWYGTRLGKSCR